MWMMNNGDLFQSFHRIQVCFPAPIILRIDALQTFAALEHLSVDPGGALQLPSLHLLLCEMKASAAILSTNESLILITYIGKK